MRQALLKLWNTSEKFSYRALFITFFVLCGLSARGHAATSPGKIDVALSSDGLTLENSHILLKISNRLVVKPALKVGEGLVSFVSSETGAKPTFGLTVGGRDITNFQVDWETLRENELDDCLGKGREIVVRALSDPLYNRVFRDVRLAAEVSFSFYEKYPTTVITRAKFTNISKFNLELDKLVSFFFRLDRRLLEPDERPWRFASYQGAAYSWSQDYSLIWITDDFRRKNFMGVDSRPNKELMGWGTPLIDLWAPQCGLALASVEPQPEWFSMPVRTAGDGLVEISIEEEPEALLGQRTSLAPGESCSTIRTAFILHRLDYYEPLNTLAEILRDQGIAIPESSPRQCYEPYWKTWAFKTNFTLDKIYNTLPQLKRIGVGWANLDDGWFTWHGDWEPNPARGKFPAGETDMIDFVRRIHKAGFKSSLWWYPQGAHPESRVARGQPGLLVRNEDGTFPLSECGDYYFCPAFPEAIEYITAKTRKIMQEWDFDGLYVDFGDIIATPPCFAPEHGHASPLDSFRKQYKFYEAIYNTAQEIKPGCPVEMCICALPHDPFKMPFYNVASASDPVNLLQTRLRIKVEKALHGPSFCVGDAYQLPLQDWYKGHRPESFENALGIGAQVTTFFRELTPAQEKLYKRWIEIYDKLDMGTANGEYLNLYDVAFDKPECHVVGENGKIYYGFFADYWYSRDKLELRGLEKGKIYRVLDYANAVDMGTVSGDDPQLAVSFKESLLLELTPEN
jgi:alpha-galactosidase